MTIPYSTLIDVTPSVIAPADGVSTLYSLVLSSSEAASGLPIYESADDVGTAFGTASVEYQQAEVFFTGFTNSSNTPAQLQFAYIGSNSLSSSGISAFMDSLALEADFSGYTHAFAMSTAELLAFAEWNDAQGEQYVFSGWDTNSAPTSGSATSSFGYVAVKQQNYSGVLAVYGDPLAAILPLGVMSSLDFESDNGRVSLAYRANSLITPAVTSGTALTYLIANGYNFVGSFGNGSSTSQFFWNGQIGGDFDWFDSYICQIQLTKACQEAFITNLQEVGTVPFTAAGDALIEGWLADPIQNALDFGTIQTGVTLSASEIADIKAKVGTDVSSTIETDGYYLVAGASTASASVRKSRGPITPLLIYTDGESVQTVSMSSIDVL